MPPKYGVCGDCHKGDHRNCRNAEYLFAEEPPKFTCTCFYDDPDYHFILLQEREADEESLAKRSKQECSCPHCELGG